jgi:serpin B
LNVDKRVLISIANSVWTENDFPVKKQFSDILTVFYNADARLFDINNTAAPDEINKWIDDKTNGLIKNMIDELPDNTVMLLINAIYFKGSWSSQFDKAKTVTRPFYRSDGSSVQVPMMNQEFDFKVYSGNGFLMGEFPYGQGNFVMDVILPAERNGADNLIQWLTDESFNSMVNGLRETKIELSFPRFKYGYKKQLNEILADMGMGIAFTDMADFSNIADTNLCISKVLHQAFIETNEEGTVAAAATVVEIGYTSVGPFFMNLDHPFVYIIRETSTNTILFMGKVADPSTN